MTTPYPFDPEALSRATRYAFHASDAELARLMALTACPSADLTTEERSAYCIEASARLTARPTPPPVRPDWIARYNDAKAN